MESRFSLDDAHIKSGFFVDEIYMNFRWSVNELIMKSRGILGKFLKLKIKSKWTVRWSVDNSMKYRWSQLGV